MTDGPSPAMKQYYTAKAQHPDALLLFQMGDFYETFGEDAGIVARELDIVLTTRGRDKNGDRMPLAGVPLHAAESYIARLVNKGYKVVLCDQVEDPKLAKGVVKRDVVRIITPGTVIDSAMLGSSGAQYLMAIAPAGKTGYGLAFLDVSTGEFFVSCDTQRDFSGIVSEVVKYRPSECIVPGAIPDRLIARLEQQDVLVSRYRDDAFVPDTARRLLCTQFGVSTLEGYGCDAMEGAVAAAGAALQYARETQRSELAHIRSLSTRIPGEKMVLDAVTLRNLEITQNLRGAKEDATLLGVLDRTETPMGSRLIRSWITAPLIVPAEINRRLDAVEFFVRQTMARAGLRSLLHYCADVERIAGRISYGNVGPRDLITLKESLEQVPEIKVLFSGNLPACIAESLDGITDPDALTALIGRAIVDEPPAVAKNGGMIREGYNTDLDELRSLSRSGKDWIADFQQKERDRTGIRSLKIGYNRVFGYYIEVTKSNLNLVPPGYERKQTTANGERYTLPELREKESLIATAEERLSTLEAEIYADLVKCLADYVPDLQRLAQSIAVLDVFSALAETAAKRGYVRPVLDESTRIVIREGKHPVVERSLESGFVPNDTLLDAGSDQLLIITGANMAGKSTYMRAVALICIMAQTGSFVPAAHATVGIVDRVFTRVGAFDDLASGQSTFMVEMLELANILNNLSNRSLLILDEIGRGTSTLDGYSIARAVVEHLHGKTVQGPRTLFATHFHELVELEGTLKRVKNYHFAVRDTGKDVIFLRKIIPGATDRSYGIHVAETAGIPQKVIERARAVLKETMQREAVTGPRAPRYTQMLLVDAADTVEATHPAVEELRSLNIDEMTPLAALTALHRLQTLVKNGGDER